MTSPALYVLAQEYRAAADTLADLDLDAQTIADTLDGLAGDLRAKATHVAMIVRQLDVSAAAMSEAASQIDARRRAVEARAASLRAYLLVAMQHAGISRVECPQLALSVRANPPAVEVFDDAQVPAQYMRTPEPMPPAPDKSAIKRALAAGADVPGCRLTHGARLEIR